MSRALLVGVPVVVVVVVFVVVVVVDVIEFLSNGCWTLMSSIRNVDTPRIMVMAKSAHNLPLILG